MKTLTRRAVGAGFWTTLSIVAMVAPLLLVLYAFATQDEIVAKTDLIVRGCELIAGGLLAALVLGSAYLFGLVRAPAHRGGDLDSSRRELVDRAVDPT